MKIEVHKVVVKGLPLVSFTRLPELRGKVGVEIYWGRQCKDSGAKREIKYWATSARLSDFHGVVPSSGDKFIQSFVAGKILDRAEQLLEKNQNVRSRSDLKEDGVIDFSNLPFGLNASDVMFMARIPRGGDWRKVSVLDSLYSFGEISLSPAAQVINYGQGGFEGCKAYRSVKERIVSFRLTENARRLQNTARRLVLTPVPEEIFLEAVRQTVLANQHLLAPAGYGASMYIRPVHFGSGPQLGVAPAPEETFLIYVSPVGPYFKGGMSPKAMFVEEKYKRSAPGLTGDVKAAGNYAVGLLPATQAKGENFSEVLYLDYYGNVEEVGAANVFFVIGNKIFTPPLSGTILPGITRDSVITLARDLGFEVEDKRPLPLELALKADEVFCTGTAAVITPVGSLTKANGEKVVFSDNQVGPVTRKLYDTLVGIQEERIPDPYGWVYPLT